MATTHGPLAPPRRGGLVFLLLAPAACGAGADYHDARAPLDAAADATAGTPDAADPPDAPALDAATPDAGPAVLTTPGGFTPGLGSLCGLGYDHVDAQVWVYPCSGADLHGFTVAGVAAATVARPGEAANDVDLAFAPTAVVIGATPVAAGGMLFVNGETGAAEVHLPDSAGATALATAFGASHVVGGAYHAGRDTLFLVQDRVAVSAANTIAEVDRVTGAVLGSFSTLPALDVNFGDLEICQASGHLFVVSSIEATIAELSATGALLAEHPLPASVVAVSGLGLGPDGQAWVSGTGGEVWPIDGLPCPAAP